MKTRHTILHYYNKNNKNRPIYMKHPLKREWNTTFDVMITGLMFSSNRAHHLVI